MKTFAILPILTICLATSSLVFAQKNAGVAQPASVPQASGAQCEVHIWPAARVAATTQGAGASFGLIGGLIDAASHADQNKRDKAFITAALDPAVQAKAMDELNLPNLLGLPASKVVTHPQGVDLKNDDPKRLDSSTAPCYYDVVVRGLFYLKTMVTKGKMRAFIAIRGFKGDKVALNYKDSANNRLNVVLPKEGEDAGPSNDALIKAFKEDVTEFAQKFVKKTKPEARIITASR